MPHQRNTTMTRSEIKDFYAGRANGLAKDILALKRKSRALVAAELATFIAAIALVAAYTAIDGAGRWTLFAAAVALAAYIVARRIDVATGNRIDELTAMRAVYDNELRYLDGDFSHFDDGTQHIDPRHEYTYDMDIFGPQSLYNRICRTATTGGADRLAKTLATCAIGTGDKAQTAAHIRLQSEAIREVAAQETWRTRFIATGHTGSIDTAKVAQALAEAGKVEVSDVAMSTVLLVAAWAAIVGFIAVVVAAACGMADGGVAVWWGILQFAVVFAACSKPLHAISGIVGRLLPQLKAYSTLARLMAESGLKADDNRRLVDALGNGEAGALRSLAELEGIVGKLDRRGNVLGMILTNVLLLSDYFLVRSFLRWQRRYMDCIGAWVDAVSEMDARVSMATFRYNEPQAIDAEVADSDNVVFEAKGIVHPFLGAKGVANDFAMADGHCYIVTGANMAGKSTFLRSIGTNYILAMAGMPVFAQSLRVSVFALFSSMRTSDDLAHGISYFNAELLRLRQLIDCCRKSRRTLIILDEILKGTNSLDKLNGSRMFLEAIAKLPVTGLVATHDLELSKMADEHPDRIANYCFEIKMANEITYTYKIAPGVARNQNASFLLKNILKNIDA